MRVVASDDGKFVKSEIREVYLYVFHYRVIKVISFHLSKEYRCWWS